MKRKLYIIFSAIIIACIFGGYSLYSYYAPPIERFPYSIPHHTDDTLRIAFIGDSWAAMHKEHECIIAKMISDSIRRPVKVSSYGLHGKTSKEIYESLFDNKVMRYFMMKGYDYCFVSAGINDTYKKISSNYYKKSMDYIIKFLTYNHICPIILEIPDYDIQKAYNRQETTRILLRKFSMLITGSRLDCKQEFRNTLNALISEQQYHQVTILNYQKWNAHGQHDQHKIYLDDGMHLNSKGYARLDSCIALIIFDLQKNI